MKSPRLGPLEAYRNTFLHAVIVEDSRGEGGIPIRLLRSQTEKNLKQGKEDVFPKDCFFLWTQDFTRAVMDVPTFFWNFAGHLLSALQS